MLATSRLTSLERRGRNGGKFEVYEDKAGKFRFRLKAGNGEIVAVGEGYDTKAAAQEGCAAVQRAADGADVVEADN